MKFFDGLFDIDLKDEYLVAGLNNELNSVYIYEYFNKNNKNVYYYAHSSNRNGYDTTSANSYSFKDILKVEMIYIVDVK